MRRRARRSAQNSVAQFIVAAALAVLTVSAAWASPDRVPVPSSSQIRTARRLTSQALVRRPFEHARHESLPCRGCHGAGAAHRTTRVRAPTDCAACHHDPGRSLACNTCHRADVIPATRTVRLTLHVSWRIAPTRRHVQARRPPRHDGGTRLQGLPRRGSDPGQGPRVRFLSLIAPLGSDGMHELSCPARAWRA